MKFTTRKDDLDTRFCIRCFILESEVKKKGSGGCNVGWGGYYKQHSYTTERELEKGIEIS